ncbi:uncharacterized protein [Haliotis cracherodii]|uniref:uncharacterized protein n=1 Tax=Haliotis cracherodii TaxID=6455 RepID=UPI0039EB8909
MAGLHNVEFVMSQRGKPQVLFDGYLHTKNVERLTCVHWKCVKSTCRGRLTTVGTVMRNATEHNHAPEDSQKVRFMSTLRKRAKEESTPMHTLYNDKLSNFNNAETGMMPPFSTMSSALYRHRQKTIPVLPQTRSEVDLQDSWTQTADGRPFLLFADGNDDKILAFGSLESLEALQSSEILYMDGTFTACPGLWNQVYIIHARLGATTYPPIFALLPDRQTNTYSRLFRLLKDEVQQRLNRPLAPSCIQTDFEMAAIRAVQVVFPTADVKGCFFHSIPFPGSGTSCRLSRRS